MRFPIPLLQRYILAELLRVFMFVLLCLTVLLVFVGVFQQASESGLGPMELMQILPYIVPSLLPFTIPSALLLTVSIVYGRIAGDQEVTAAKAAGINVLSLLWPAFFLGAILSLLSLILTDQVIPWAVTNIERTIVRTMEDIFLRRLRTEHQFADHQSGVLITVSEVDGRVLKDPIISYSRGDQRPIVLQAKEAEISLDLQNQQAVLTLRNGHIDALEQRIYFHDEITERIAWVSNLSQPKPRHLPIDEIRGELVSLTLQRKQLDERRMVETAMALTLGEFHRLEGRGLSSSASLREAEVRYYKLHTEIQSRYALSCSCFFFALLGSPFAILKAKSQFLTSFLFCFGPIVGCYYPIMLGMMTQAKRGHVQPEWSMWLANGLVAVAAWFVLRRVMRH